MNQMGPYQNGLMLTLKNQMGPDQNWVILSIEEPNEHRSKWMNYLLNNQIRLNQNGLMFTKWAPIKMG